MEPSTSMDKGSSSKSRCGQKWTGLPKLTPKHKIFLSHSGKQKEFVRQLCKDLEAETHHPFFDERSSSLTMGERFAPLIFEATRQCLVAVIVLSEDFLTSKWPMLELLEFVEAKKFHNPHLKLLPLFYKLSLEDLKVASNVSRWEAAWVKINTPKSNQVMPQEDDTHRQLNLSLCIEALHELCGVNGFKFKNFASEVAYREAIVKEISLLVAPDLLDDTSDIIGNERLCKVVGDMFVKDTREGSNLWGIHKLGLYGMVGLGKTIMSRALCMFFYKCFNGRVFRVEIGSRPPLDMQKLVLTKLLRINQDLVEQVHTEHEGRKLLKDYMNQQRVFLVIDNITDDCNSQIQALTFLEAGFHPGSMIMITSRSLDVIEKLFPSHSNAIYCKALPMLSKEEAKLIFLQEMAPQQKLDTLTTQERKNLKKCLSQCHFLLDNKERQYHPLALQALASYCGKDDNLNMSKWNGNLEDLKDLRLSDTLSNTFVDWGLQFMTFAMKKKFIFLDLCLYIDQYLLIKSFSKVLSWLAPIHECTQKVVESQLQSLKRLGFINITLNKVGDQFITIHDLYREFAKWYVIDGEGSHCQEFRCVYHTSSTNSLPSVLRRTSGSSSELQRIHLQNLECVTFPSIIVQKWCNVVVLQIHECFNLKVLDLYGLSCLCHLELVKLCKLESFYCTKLQADNNNKSNGAIGLLQHVVLIFLRSLKHLPDFSPCTSLKTFRMLECERFLPKPPRFMGCSQLEDLNLDWNKHWQVEEFKLDTLTSLTFLKVRNKTLAGTSKWSTLSPLEAMDFLTLTGLGNCSQLEILLLVALPITSLLGLEKLTKLQELHISLCGSLQYIPNVSALVRLRNLLIVKGLFQQIPGVEGLLRLRRLQLIDNLQLKSLPDLDHLQKLTYVQLLGCSLLKVQPRLPPGCELVSKNT